MFQGYIASTVVTVAGALYAWILNSVTSPNDPPPAPRNAQNRSGLDVALTFQMLPLASTMVNPTMLSDSMPYLRPTIPMPPPRACPPTPTPGHDPAGTRYSPAFHSLVYKGPRRLPAPTVAIAVS